MNEAMVFMLETYASDHLHGVRRVRENMPSNEKKTPSGNTRGATGNQAVDGKLDFIDRLHFITIDGRQFAVMAYSQGDAERQVRDAMCWWKSWSDHLRDDIESWRDRFLGKWHIEEGWDVTNNPG